MGTALNILGGLAVFLYGLRVMSNGLERLAGNRLRAILAALTRNRFTGILGGFAITGLVQSSSATTVLVVSFANAGLLTLVQAMGLVMGANIGTTITGWLVSLFGFKVSISAFALPIIGIGFPMSFMSRERFRNLAEVLVGFGLLFLGLGFLKAGVPTIDPSNAADLAKLEFVQHFTGYGYGSVFIFVAIGTVLTVVIQSSSATMAITLVLANQGWIDYQLAAAMVLGENLGTTITANLAAIGTTRNAVRVARFHSIFNIIGVVWMLAAMPLVLGMLPAITGGDPVSNPTDRTTALALFHTFFNITNTFILVWFAPFLEKLVMKLVPRRPDESEEPHLKFIRGTVLETPSMAEYEAGKALAKVGELCVSMYEASTRGLTHPEEVAFGALLDELRKQEKITDEMQEELVDFCADLAAAGSSARSTAVVDTVDELENIGDCCLELGILGAERKRVVQQFGDEADAELAEMVEVTGKLLKLTVAGLHPDAADNDVEAAEQLLTRARTLRNDSRSQFAERMSKSERSPSGAGPGPGHTDVRSGLMFLDIMNTLLSIAEYARSAQYSSQQHTH